MSYYVSFSEQKCGLIVLVGRLLMLLTKENVPNPTVLGSTNGLVQCSMCLARCISAIASRYGGIPSYLCMCF